MQADSLMLMGICKVSFMDHLSRKVLSIFDKKILGRTERSSWEDQALTPNNPSRSSTNKVYGTAVKGLTKVSVHFARKNN